MSKQELFIRNWGKLLAFAFKADIKVLTYWGYRTAKQQAKMFERGVSSKDGYIKLSKHQLGRAGDLAVKKHGKLVWKDCKEYTKLGEYWESLGGRWGGRWTSPHDPYHFEV